MAKKKQFEEKIDENAASAGEIPAEEQATEVQENLNIESEVIDLGVSEEKEESAPVVDESDSKIEVHADGKKDRIAIFTQNWMEVAAYSAHVRDKNINPWRKGQVVYLDADIDRLLQLNAPIKVYVEDGAN